MPHQLKPRRFTGLELMENLCSTAHLLPQTISANVHYSSNRTSFMLIDEERICVCLLDNYSDYTLWQIHIVTNVNSEGYSIALNRGVNAKAPPASIM